MLFKFVLESNSPSNLIRTPILKAIFGRKRCALYSRKYGILYHWMHKFVLDNRLNSTYFSTVVPLKSFISCRPFVVKVLLGVEVTSVSWLGQLTVWFQITDNFNCLVSKFLLLLGLGFWSWSWNHWWGEKFVHWVVLSWRC